MRHARIRPFLFLALFVLLFCTFIDAQFTFVVMAKDEGLSLSATLTSALPWMSSLILCDTGSTDNTLRIAHEFLFNHNKPGKVVSHNWTDFGTNRNLCLEEARKFSSPNYLWIMDANEKVQVTEESCLQDLSQDYYYVMESRGGLVYRKIRILKSAAKCAYEGVTHEVMICADTLSSSTLTEVTVINPPTRTLNVDRFRRDAELLRTALLKDPENARYMFYLARSLDDAGQEDEAIPWYLKRIEKKGWVQEVLMCHFYIGVIFEGKGENSWPSALAHYLKAHSLDRRRIEPLYRIALHYRISEDYPLCFMFARQAQLLSGLRPADGLFIFQEVYEWMVDNELCICAYYVKEMEIGRNACLSVTEKQNEGSSLAESNLRWYPAPSTPPLGDITAILQSPTRVHVQKGRRRPLFPQRSWEIAMVDYNRDILGGSQRYLWVLAELLRNQTNPPLKVDYYHEIPSKSVLCSYDLVVTQQFASLDLLSRSGGVCSNVLIAKIVHGPSQLHPEREDPDIIIYCSHEQHTLAHNSYPASFFSHRFEAVLHPLVLREEFTEGRKSKWHSRPFDVAFIGSEKLKGISTFLEVVRDLPGISFLWVTSLALVDPLPSNVVVCPLTQNITKDVYSKSKVLMVPSLIEAAGMVIAEAHYAGCSVIASDLVGTREFSCEEVGGKASCIAHLVADPKNVTSWKTSIRTALSEGPQVENIAYWRARDAREKVSALYHTLLDEWNVQKFVVVIVNGNDDSRAVNALRSALSQDYPLFRIIFIDESGKEETWSSINKEVRAHPRVEVSQLSFAEKKGRVFRQWEALHGCDHEEIIVFLGVGDMMANNKVLTNLNNAYVTNKCWMTVGGCHSYPGAQPLPRISEPCNSFKTSNQFNCQFVSFFGWLGRLTREDILQYAMKENYSYASEPAIILPMLEMAQHHIHTFAANQTMYLSSQDEFPQQQILSKDLCKRKVSSALPGRFPLRQHALRT